jgi:hypothetical protein
MRTPTLIKARRGVSVAAGLCFLTLGAGGAWALATVTTRPPSHRPPAPRFRTVPPLTTTQRSAVFSFVDRQRRVYFQCSLDGAAFKLCASRVRYGPGVEPGRMRCKGQPRRVKGRRVKWCSRRTPSRQRPLALGRHSFRVRAVSGRLTGPPTTYRWTITRMPAPVIPPPSQPGAGGVGGGIAPVGVQATFSIAGGPEGSLYPGAAPRRIALVLTNPHAVVIYVTALAVNATTEDLGCPVDENVLITQSNVSPITPVAVPPGVSVTLPVQGITAPTIQLIDLQSVNQDACKGATFVLHYTGSAYE